MSVVEHLLGADRESALQEQVVVDLAELPTEVGVADRVRPALTDEAEQGGTGRPESKRNSTGFVQTGFSGVVVACLRSGRWMVVRETR